MLFFLAFEVFERVWLAGSEMERLHGFHRARGLLSSAAAAVLAAWLVLRTSPPLFESRPGDGGGGPETRLDPAVRAEHYARWFIVMRWIAVLVAVVLVGFAIRVFHFLPAHLSRPLLLTIAGLAALNGLYLLLLRRRLSASALLPVQAYGDLLVLTVLLHFSGGVENPLGILMLFHVIIAGIVLPRHHCYAVAAAGTVLYGSLALAEWGGWIPHYTLGIIGDSHSAAGVLHAAHDVGYVVSRVALQAAILLLTAYFTTTVTGQLRREEKALERLADRLLAQRQLLERALETTGTSLCVCDQELNPNWRNNRWEEWFGGAGSAACDAVEPAGEAPARETLRDGKVRITEVTRGSECGCPAALRVYQLTTAPLLDKDGVRTQVVQLAQEITEQKRIQARMVQAEKLAAVGELAGKVAHEVNNPVAIISAKTRLLLSDHGHELSPRTAEELGKITDLADRVARVASGLLSYCRVATGPATPIDVRVPIRKALASIEPAATVGGVRVVDRLPEDLPRVRAHADEMEQVFLNLFLNALDAMPAGGRLVVSCASRAEAPRDGRPMLDVVVEDSGCGIPAELKELVFEPFVTTKPEGKGTGLGLSICLGLVRGNGGEIELESEPGRGTRARLGLPLEGQTTVSGEPAGETTVAEESAWESEAEERQAARV